MQILNMNGFTAAPVKGDLVSANEVAIVSTNNMQRLHMLVPDDVNSNPSRTAEFLFACFMRFHADQAFVDAMLSWLDRLEAEFDSEISQRH